MNEKIKKLTGKNRADYEPVALRLVDSADVNLFKELVNQDDFLFDFIKQNVAERLEHATNKSNYRNLLKLMVVYSPYYDDFIASTLAKFANEDLTDEILEIFENGTDSEKTYCAKYFSHIQDSLALPLLREYAFSENQALAQNCAQTLGIFKDTESYEIALKKLRSDDDFEQFEGVNFLISYGNKSAVTKIIEVMRISGMAENIAGQIPYLEDLSELIEKDFDSGLLVLNNILNGLGEINPISSVIDFNMWEILNSLLNENINSKIGTVLINARTKFDTLTENDEYLYDEDKNTKNEVYEIKKLLSEKEIDISLVDGELRPDSDFVYTALDISQNKDKIKELLNSDNQTVIIKSAETLRKLGGWNEELLGIALKHINDENLKAILKAL